MGALVVRWLATWRHATVASAVAATLRRSAAFGSAIKLKTELSNCTKIARSASTAAAIVAVLGVASADGVGVMDRPRPAYDPKGIPLGAFRLFPSVDLRLNTTNNVFETNAGRKGDTFVEVVPALRLTSEWSEHQLEFFGSLNASRYADHTGEDATDWIVGANGRLDIRRSSALTAGLSDARLHERRSSPNSPGNVAEPIEYSVFHMHGSVAVEPNRLRAELSGQFDQYRYDNTPLTGGGLLDNGDRDRDELRLRARVSLEVSEGYRAFVEGLYDRRDFERAIDRTGVNRDSTGTGLGGGFEFKLVEFLQGEVFVGYLDRQFGAPLQDFSGFNYGATLKWSVTPLTTVHLQAVRELADTVVAGSSTISDKRFSFGIDHELRRNVIVQANVTHVDRAFVGISRDDSEFEGHIGATYLIDDNLSATAGYERRERDSSVPDQGFSENKFHVGIHIQL